MIAMAMHPEKAEEIPMTEDSQETELWL
jgi:hypothetical protein